MRNRGLFMAIVFLAAMVGVAGASELVVRSVVPEPAAAAEPPAEPGLSVLSGDGGAREDGPKASAGFDVLADMALDSTGAYLYVIEIGNAGRPTALRKVSTATGEVSTLSTDPVLADARYVQVDANGDPWVATRLGANNKGIVRVSHESGAIDVRLSNLCCAFAGTDTSVGNAFYIDSSGGHLYYTTAVAEKAQLHRISLSGLPSTGAAGTPLGLPPGTAYNDFPGPIVDMEMSPTRRLYMVWQGSNGGLLVYDGSSITRVHAGGNNHTSAWQTNVLDRVAFRAGSSSMYNVCAGVSCSMIERRADFGEAPITQRSPIAGIVDGPGVESNDFADGDPGRLDNPTGLVISPDGTKAWIADAGNRRIRELVLPPDPNVLSPEELCGECNPGERRISVPKVLDPVDLPSGSLTESFTDLVVPSRGRPLLASRTYNSLLGQRPGRFGLGWSSALDLKLEEWSGYAQVRQENGSILPFSRLLDGSYLAPPRVTSTLAKDGTGWVLTRNGTDVVRFDAEGRVTSFEERRRTAVHPTRVTTLSYPTGQIVMTSPGGRTLTFTLDGERVASVSDDSSPARTVTYTYSTAGRLTAVSSFKMNDDDTASVTWGYAYNATSGLLESVTNPRGHSNFTHYDGQGRVDYQLEYSATPQGGARSDIAYGPAGSVTWRDVTTPAYRADGTRSTTRYELTDLLVTSVTTGYGTTDARTTRYEYDSNGLMAIAKVIGEGDVELASFTYDAAGNVTKSIDAAGRATEFFDYDEFNQPERVEDNAGIVTTNTYGDGYLVETSTPIVSPTGISEGTAVTTYLRGDPANPEDVTEIIAADQQGDEEPATWKFDYRDGDGLLNWEEDPEGNRTTYTYDDRGYVRSVVSPRGNEAGKNPDDYRTTFDVNDFGLVQSVTDPLQKSSMQRFDGNGNTVYSRDANLSETETTFDPMDRPRIVVRAEGSDAETTVESTYFPNGALSQQINGLNAATTYAYDVHGAVVSMTVPGSATNPAGDTTGYGYDDLGRLETRTDPGGSCPGSGCVTYGYNPGSELNAITYSDPATPDVTTITYDPVGRRKSMGQAGRPASAWTWDSLGRMRSSTDINGRTVAYGYTPGGLLEAITYPGQATPVTYTYDDAGQMETVEDWTGRETSFDHDADGNWTDTTFPAATSNTDERVYDNAGRLASVTWRKGTTVLGSLTYTRDDNGLLESETPTGVPAFSTRNWGYDELDQLDQVNTAILDHDAAGNLTRTEDGTLQVFDPAQRLCWSSPTATTGTCGTPATDATVYGYDARGNRTASTTPDGDTTTFSYDQENRMTGARIPTAEDSGGSFVSLAPSRVADTRGAGSGVCNGGTCDRLGAGASMTVQVTGRGTVPVSGVAAVTGTITIASPGANGYSRVNPGGTGAAATINYQSGINEGGYVIAPVDSQGRITIYTSAAADVVVDITGYYAQPGSTGAGFEALPPARLVDTRTPNNIGLCPATACTTPVAGTTTQVQASGRAGLPSTGATAAVISLTIVGPPTSGYARINPSGGSGAATVNYVAGQAANEVVVVPLNSQGRLSVFVSTAVDVVIDVTGYLHAGDGSQLRTITPHRTFDTRTTTGTCTPGPCDRLTANERTTITATGIPTGADAIVAWITVAAPAANGYLRVAPVGPATGTAGAATINYQAGTAADSLVIVPLTPTGTFDIATIAATDVIIDITGYLTTHDTWTYTYDATGLRSAKKEGTAAQYQFTWNRASGLPLLLGQHVNGAVNHLVYGPDGMPIYQITSIGAVQYFHQDQLGSTRLVTDANGNYFGSLTYDAYGRPTSNTTAAHLDRPLVGYTGEYTDAETGYVYLRARYLDPVTGVFTTVDPQVSVTLDPFAYAGGDPVNYVDPSGQAQQDLPGGKCIRIPFTEAPDCEGADGPSKLCHRYQDNCETFSEEHPELVPLIITAAALAIVGLGCIAFPLQCGTLFFTSPTWVPFVFMSIGLAGVAKDQSCDPDDLKFLEGGLNGQGITTPGNPQVQTPDDEPSYPGPPQRGQTRPVGPRLPQGPNPGVRPGGVR